MGCQLETRLYPVTPSIVERISSTADSLSPPFRATDTARSAAACARSALSLQPGGALVGLHHRPPELEEQARLADAGVPRQGHDLTVAALDLREPLEQGA